MGTLGFIGCGNMGSAMLSGALANGFVAPANVVVSARSAATRDAIAQRFGVRTTADNAEVAACDMVVLAVKPQVLEGVLVQVRDAFTEGTLLISVAAGKSIEWLAQTSGVSRIARLMPNTPAAIGCGMTSVAFADGLGEADQQTVLSFAESFGRTELIPEHLFDAASAVAGCSPAYVYMFIEAMADAGVAEGLPRATAYRLAAAAVAGSGNMVLETGKHPGELKDAVCSPAGTTIAGVRAMEAGGFRSAVMEGLLATCAKAKGL